jgi:GNAT superfamily N-acetyltransferase
VTAARCGARLVHEFTISVTTSSLPTVARGKPVASDTRTAHDEQVRITPFRPDDTAGIDAWVALVDDQLAVDAPWDYRPRREEVVGQLTHGWDGEPETPYLCTVDGELVAVALLGITERDNRHLAGCHVAVHPARRRQGHGSEVVGFLEREAARLGRTVVSGWGWETEAYRAFAASKGYAEVMRAVNRRQRLADVDRAALAAAVEAARPASADYVIERWPVPAPEDQLAALAELASTINDAPTEDMTIEDEVFDADRVRAYETATAGRGERMYRLVARHRTTSELAGHTVVVVAAVRPDVAHQHDTAVVAAHRGHRLGLLLKAAMLDVLAEHEPAVAEISTWNAHSNEHMIGVNELMGYRAVGTELVVERTLGE